MSDYTKVTSAAMDGGIAALRKALNDFNNTKETLNRQLASSLADWSGQARAQYSQYQASWDAQATRMEELINKMQLVLTQITDSYAANEAAVRNSWR